MTNEGYKEDVLQIAISDPHLAELARKLTPSEFRKKISERYRQISPGEQEEIAAALIAKSKEISVEEIEEIDSTEFEEISEGEGIVEEIVSSKRDEVGITLQKEGVLSHEERNTLSQASRDLMIPFMSNFFSTLKDLLIEKPVFSMEDGEKKQGRMKALFDILKSVEQLVTLFIQKILQIEGVEGLNDKRLQGYFHEAGGQVLRVLRLIKSFKVAKRSMGKLEVLAKHFQAIVDGEAPPEQAQVIMGKKKRETEKKDVRRIPRSKGTSVFRRRKK